ncbi:putative secreted protein (Por secretion system target) [Ulvibacter sp. MAR_2010_11]|uniref:YCF48-related protein n=1 Tax=Ulvibacter sp. MAR_2010_11 TaxID=1250229 RepID=UPI000CBF5475|nr:YCF48-related protein [Ulvibacter sp. MAR_2010_11]PKA82156.1 putative secreted protein (Por secretion system target) [Ulvibacter sp. MAR_2010_11]
MKKTILFTLLACAIGTGSLLAQFVVKPTFFETTGVSNDGIVAGYEGQSGPYSLWDADNDTFVNIGGVAPGLGHGGMARFSADGNTISGSEYFTLNTPTEWEKLNTGFNYIFRGIEFPENQNDIAFAAGESSTYNGDGIVIKTTDGGTTWTEIWSGAGQGLEGISFPTLYTGYVAGFGGYFAKTTDGGATWQQQTPIPDVFFYREMAFKDENNGVITAQTNTGSAVYWTNDGGQNWTEGTGLTSVPYQITYVSGNTYFLVTNSGQIQKSVDNGATWTTIFTGTPEFLIGIDFYNEMIGIVTTYYDNDGNNYAYKTVDGGATWQPYLVAQAGAILRDVAWKDENNLTIVGTPELIFGSEDGGETWPIDNFGTSTFTEALYEVLYTSNGTGYIIGSQGVMFRKQSESNTYSVMSMYDVPTDTWTTLGHFDYPVDGGLSSGYNVSGDGSTVVGSAWVEPNPNEIGLTTNACVWTAATGIVNLGSLFSETNRGTRAQAVSHDGSVIGGWQDFNGPWKSAVWRKDTNGDYLPNEYLLLDPNGDPTDENNQLSEVTAISADGNWIGGRSDWVTNNEPYIWSEATGAILLGTLAPNGQGHVTAINHDGSIVIGYFQIGPWDPNVPFIWTSAGGLQEFGEFVTGTLGYEMAASPVYAPNAMSPNGQYITGWGYDPNIGPWGDLFTFRLQMPTVPLNDVCVDAEALVCGTTVTNSTIFGTNTGGNGSPDVYYSYTGNGVQETITLNACGPETNFPTTVRVYSDCTLTNQITFNDSSCDNNPELSFESDGTSTYIIMVEGYNSSAAGNFQLSISCEEIVLGISDQTINNTVLYPNPVQNVLQISSKVEMTEASVYSMSGALVITKNIGATTSEIDFSSLTTGMYFVKVTSENSVETFKIIKD